jgi:PAS domain S-box-containing protein
MSSNWSAGPFDKLLETLPDGVVVATPDGTIVAVNSQICALSGRMPDELIDAPIEVLVPSAKRAEHVALRSAYVAEGGAARPMSRRLDIGMLRADGTELPVDIALATMKLDDEGFVIATVRDASARREAELRSSQERALLDAANQIAESLLEDDDRDTTLRSIARHARTLVGADFVAVTTPDDGADEANLVMRIVEGLDVDHLEGSAIPLSSSMAGTVIRGREPQLLSDASSDPRMYRPPGWPSDSGPALFVPMFAGSATLGSLIVVRRHHRPMFTVEEIGRIRVLASRASIAIEHARRQDAIHRLEALDEDRQRLATAVQETVIARVSSVSLRLHGLLREDLPEATADTMWKAIDELDDAVKAIRDAVFPRS